MSAPYSDDLRQKAVDAVDRGERKSDVCRLLGISRNTLDLWLKRREATGSVSANRTYRRGPAPKIADLEKFRQFAQKYGHLTQREMAEQWGQPISDQTIGQALKRIGFTRKKKLTGIENETKTSELHLSSN